METPMLDRRSLLAGALALSAPLPAFSAPGWKEDGQILRRAYEALHPGLYRYNTPGRMSARFDRLERELGSAGSQGEAFLALTRLTAAVRCGHSYPNPLNQPNATKAALFGGQDRLPFTFQWIDGEMVISGSVDSRLSRGLRVLSIDGVPCREMLQRLLPLARADGGNDGKRAANMALNGYDRFAAFDVYRPLLWKAGPTAVLRTAMPGGAERRIEVACLKEGEPRGAVRPEAPFLFEIRDGIGVLTMTTWGLYEEEFDWRGFIDTAMDRLVDEGARGLVVDIRDNEGGMDCGDRVLARLIERDLKKPAYDRYTRYRTAPADLKPYLSTWDRSFFDWGKDATGPDSRGLYRMTRFDDGPEGDVIAPAGRRFGGPLAVLTSATNSSATFQFALTVKTSGRGRLIGQTTGGNLRGINGSGFFFLKLPNSGLEADLPLVATLPRTTQPDSGLAPDIAVRLSAAALARGEDPEMAAALARSRCSPPS
jgi:hypothetical protein